MKTLKNLNPHILVIGGLCVAVWCLTAWAQDSGTMPATPDGSVASDWRSVAVTNDGNIGSVDWQGAGKVRIVSWGMQVDLASSHPDDVKRITSLYEDWKRDFPTPIWGRDAGAEEEDSNADNPQPTKAERIQAKQASKQSK